jgi:hypothetical protein
VITFVEQQHLPHLIINQQWTAVSGVTAVSGIIETTTTNGLLKHTIVLKSNFKVEIAPFY